MIDKLQEQTEAALNDMRNKVNDAVNLICGIRFPLTEEKIDDVKDCFIDVYNIAVDLKNAAIATESEANWEKDVIDLCKSCCDSIMEEEDTIEKEIEGFYENLKKGDDYAWLKYLENVGNLLDTCTSDFSDFKWRIDELSNVLS